MPDAQPPAARRQDAHHVEAHLLADGAPLRQVLVGREPEPAALGRGHRLHRLPESRAPAQLDLDEDQGRAVLQDQVDLPAAGPVVALDEGVSQAAEVGERELLPPRAGGRRPAQPPTPA